MTFEKQKGEGLNSWIAAIAGVAAGFIGSVAYLHQHFASNDDLKALTESLGKIQTSVLEHMNQHDIGSGNISVPSGAVVAFATKTCPTTGWESYEDAEGRFILGWSVDQSLQPNESRSFQPYYQVGGAESVMLSIQEMPQHDHTGYVGTGSQHAAHITGGGNLPQGKGSIGHSGGNQPHNNMP